MTRYGGFDIWSTLNSQPEAGVLYCLETVCPSRCQIQQMRMTSQVSFIPLSKLKSGHATLSARIVMYE